MLTEGGDILVTSGCADGGAETRRVLPGNCLEGERGEEAEVGEEREEARGRLSRAGEDPPCCRLCPTTASSSSGSGPRVEPPDAEDTPDMADTEFRSPPLGTLVLSALCLGRPEAEATREF